MTTISTPPPTTLSTPSPTERPEPDMPPSLTSNTRYIYLIVATSLSPPLGIGLRGSLPWPSIKADMSFFQRVTRDSRPPANAGQASINAVIMGRKTYDSIPAKFRPLAGRLNVVISRTPVHKLAQTITEEIKKAKEVQMEISCTESPSSDSMLLQPPPTSTIAPVLVSNSLETALSSLNQPLMTSKPIGNIFIIGGTQIYKSFLDLNLPVRILQTQIKTTNSTEFECDTFFPTNLVEGSSSDGDLKQVPPEEVQSWLQKPNNEAIALPQGVSDWAEDAKVGIELRVVGWERT